jgi:orotate phosphoribosyltransferase
MDERALLKLLKDKDAYLEGHFLLSSGLHSSKYVQCALVLQYPVHACALGEELAKSFSHDAPDVVIAPALGGLIIGHEVARALKARFIFTERIDGVMRLRRNFSLTPKEKALVVEDVITTGGSAQEIVALAKKCGATVRGVGSIVDRAEKNIDFGTKYRCLIKIEVPVYKPESCPLCQEGKVPLVKPGSRK